MQLIQGNSYILLVFYSALFNNSITFFLCLKLNISFNNLIIFICYSITKDIFNATFRSTDPELNTQLSEVYAQLQNIEADKAPAKASIILNGLGFTCEMQQRATKTFSGGWRMRLALARALFSR